MVWQLQGGPLPDTELPYGVSPFFSANFFESDVSAAAGCGDEAQFAIDREDGTHMASSFDHPF